jgi:hypothetical protein
MLRRMFREAHPDAPRPVAVDISRYILSTYSSTSEWSHQLQPDLTFRVRSPSASRGRTDKASDGVSTPSQN